MQYHMGFVLCQMDRNIFLYLVMHEKTLAYVYSTVNVA